MPRVTGALPPIRARLLVVAGALTLSPDTLLMRLARFKTKNALGKSVGLAFHRGLGRLCLTPPMWLVTQPRGSSFVAACRSLGPRRTACGAGLYVTQNVAFIVATQLTYVASVLAAVATGPLFAAAFSSVVTGERVPSHTWAAAAACVGCVGLIYADALLEQDSPKHLQARRPEPAEAGRTLPSERDSTDTHPMCIKETRTSRSSTPAATNYIHVL